MPKNLQIQEVQSSPFVLHLSLSLFLQNAKDSIKEGDGDRLKRVWKFLTFLYQLKGANKYALAGLQIQASVLGLSTQKMPAGSIGIGLLGLEKDQVPE